MSTRRILSRFLFLLVVTRGLAAQSSPLLEFSPPEWKFGMISQGEIVRTEIKAVNGSGSPLTIAFVPTCSCLTVSPAARTLAAGASAAFSLSFDSKDDEGKTSRYFIVDTEIPGAKPLFYILGGVVRADRKPAADSGYSAGASGAPASDALGGAIELRYYYTPGRRLRGIPRDRNPEAGGELRRQGRAREARSHG